ncbi:FliG C-terminal domain-containing protein [Litoreibacter roseus]|uniref:Flagellar motor switch protein FliG n=1 Tax=Litoreibacter roseus TaxID=2601869 RepID=A0A6N6JID7_9RHOB|nr:FliG C-terminal domain-containing protein [Litoreibacter roseus]GFE65845.1 flagellar motor switch protein FliG [Litoreibacter roseus]
MNTLMIPQMGAMQKSALDGVVLSGPDGLSGSQKAAIILQVALMEGGSLNLATLSDEMQKKLALEFATIKHVDESVILTVITEFEAALQRGGLDFPTDLAQRLESLTGTISDDALADLRESFGIQGTTNPWDDIGAMEDEKLAEMVTNESAKISALIMSKLGPVRASEVLEALPEDVATRITLAMADTGHVPPRTVAVVGLTLGQYIGKTEETAFAEDPVVRTAAMLNAAAASTRDKLIDALGDLDAGFAGLVRAAIFTFEDIPARVVVTDVPKITKEVSSDDLVVALVHAQENAPEAAEFILGNMSTRMADQLREEMSESNAVDTKAGEAAQGLVTRAIRELEERGDIVLQTPLEFDETPM